VHHVYVYYRIDPAQADLATTQIDALLLAMTPHCNQPARRLIRCDDAHTWMEIYEGITDFEIFSGALNSAEQASNCTEFIAGERHREYFSTPG
jgi:hypothetical protein